MDFNVEGIALCVSSYKILQCTVGGQKSIEY